MAEENPPQHGLRPGQAEGLSGASAVSRQHPVAPGEPEAGAPRPTPRQDGSAAEGDAPTVRARGFWARVASAAGVRTGRVVHGTGRRIRRATSAEGAGESGLAKLIELHALNSFGDMLITVALASTIFFSVPTGEARGRVALYLLITMAPFAVLAPVIGPLLDRLPNGRRSAMAMSMLARAALAWVMAGVVTGGGLALYPEALGVLVASKAYGVVRSVVVPRLLPAQLSLVKANSRVTLAGLLTTLVAGGVGGLLHLLGPAWPLRGAFVVFVIGTLMAFHLPHQVDSAKGEQRAELHAEPQEVRPKGVLRAVGPSVVMALRGVAALRWLVGFLVMFLAFLIRRDPPGGLPGTVALGLVAAAAGLGNALGSVLGSWLRTRGSEVTVTAVLALATAAAGAAALWYGAVTVTVVAGVAGMAASLGKLALDALIQRDVPEAVRTSAFARSETVLQLCWVAGGAVGIALPLNPVLGLTVAAAVMTVMLLWTFRSLLRIGPRRAAARARMA
ncbi:MFS transporter [Kitasatospora phosalacinea]|uniref:MFS transporter n=1 Tax=Kitasatospora phosalacinea TaxID=2065 RepID=A0A9W6Q5T7_9ACTN|nr:MFS transporter [Kitasatospora phosalacinea]